MLRSEVDDNDDEAEEDYHEGEAERNCSTSLLRITSQRDNLASLCWMALLKVFHIEWWKKYDVTLLKVYLSYSSWLIHFLSHCFHVILCLLSSFFLFSWWVTTFFLSKSSPSLQLRWRVKNRKRNYVMFPIQLHSPHLPVVTQSTLLTSCTPTFCLTSFIQSFMISFTPPTSRHPHHLPDIMQSSDSTLLTSC